MSAQMLHEFLVSRPHDELQAAYDYLGTVPQVATTCSAAPLAADGVGSNVVDDLIVRMMALFDRSKTTPVEILRLIQTVMKQISDAGGTITLTLVLQIVSEILAVFYPAA